MAKVSIFYEALKSGTSSKSHNGEGGQNGEFGRVWSDLKWIFILDYFILYHEVPNNRVKSIPIGFGLF
jgi:hypothetical protein